MTDNDDFLANLVTAGDLYDASSRAEMEVKRLSLNLLPDPGLQQAMTVAIVALNTVQKHAQIVEQKARIAAAEHTIADAHSVLQALGVTE
jgi:hypothetical protein